MSNVKRYKFEKLPARNELAFSDVPVEWAVDTDEATVSIYLIYPSAAGEKREVAIKQGRVTLWTGEHSGRLFRMDLEIGPHEPDAAVVTQIAKEIDEALSALASRAKAEGTRMNYELASGELQPTPAWLIEALTREIQQRL